MIKTARKMLASTFFQKCKWAAQSCIEIVKNAPLATITNVVVAGLVGVFGANWVIYQVLIVACITDLVIRYRIEAKRGKVQSKKFVNKIWTMAMYTLLLATLVQARYIHPSLAWIPTPVAGLMFFREFLSIVENLHELGWGWIIPDWLINQMENTLKKPRDEK